jgi:Fic family protein
MVMKNISRLSQKYRELQQARPMPPMIIANLEEWLRVELTYTSNAIEGNTLTRAETAIVLEKGLTISGKPLREHLETTNHAGAYDWGKNFIKKKPHEIDENTILEIHRLILKGIDEEEAGRYRRMSVRIAGSAVIFPNAVKVPALMQQFVTWLSDKPKLHPAELAAQVHYQLVTIHPFSDGNGRTARLLMNLVLMQSGYPPAIIQPKERLSYIRALEQAQLGAPIDDFENFIGKSVEHSLDLYLNAIRQKDVSVDLKPRHGVLLKIGELAKRAGETVPTIRFWLKEGLLIVAHRTESGYQLFEGEMVSRARLIRKLQNQRLSLKEIAEHLPQNKK